MMKPPSQQKAYKKAAHYAPVPQAMAGDEGDTQHGFDEWKQQLDAKEAELVAAQARLQQWEKRMAPVPDVMDGTSAPAAAGGASKLPSSTELEHETVLLLTRWQCLLEERKQLTAAMQRAYRTGRLGDFEPGETPMRDVTCAVITHQLDTPCLSCCFQR